MSPVVSIGMPVFNDSRYLSQALDALLAQTFSDFELIISDDGSTDGSQFVCMEYAAKDQRIRYIRQEVNLGISKNMEFLLNQAKGTYFMWAGDDDMWDTEFISTLVQALKERPDCICAFAPYTIIDGEGKVKSAFVKVDYAAPHPVERLKKLITYFNDAFGYGLFRRDMIIGVKFPVWWWVNRSCAYNNIYPTLCFYLARGNFVLAGEKSLWSGRDKPQTKVNHKVPYAQHFIRRYLSFVLRKFNLVWCSLHEVSRSTQKGSFYAMRITPAILLHWWIKPSIAELKILGKLYLDKKISFW